MTIDQKKKNCRRTDIQRQPVNLTRDRKEHQWNYIPCGASDQVTIN